MAEHLRIDELKEILRENGLETTGNKDDLISRLKMRVWSGKLVQEWISRTYAKRRVENDKLKEENDVLRKDMAKVRREKRRMQKRIDKLQRENDRLKRSLEKKKKGVVVPKIKAPIVKKAAPKTRTKYDEFQRRIGYEPSRDNVAGPSAKSWLKRSSANIETWTIERKYDDYESGSTSESLDDE